MFTPASQDIMQFIADAPESDDLDTDPIIYGVGPNKVIGTHLFVLEQPSDRIPDNTFCFVDVSDEEELVRGFQATTETPGPQTLSTGFTIETERVRVRIVGRTGVYRQYQTMIHDSYRFVRYLTTRGNDTTQDALKSSSSPVGRDEDDVIFFYSSFVRMAGPMFVGQDENKRNQAAVTVRAVRIHKIEE